jgi:hypothetical protein
VTPGGAIDSNDDWTACKSATPLHQAQPGEQDNQPAKSGDMNELAHR